MDQRAERIREALTSDLDHILADRLDLLRAFDAEAVHRVQGTVLAVRVPARFIVRNW